VPPHHQQIVRLACFDVINLCVRLYTIFDTPLSTRNITELSGFESPSELNSAIKDLLFDLSDAVQEKLNSSMASTKYNLIGFVQQHFRDSNLSLGLLADEFGLSQSYISKLFKEETGQNFISYVKQLRMSYVKKQLMATDLQVKDIILDTGYVDVANFARTFKQEVGLTPLQYRHNIRQNG
jgi:AraC-like DNA-binding protein